MEDSRRGADPETETSATPYSHDAKMSEILDKLDEVLAEVRRTRTVLAERIQEFYDHFDGMTSDM